MCDYLLFLPIGQAENLNLLNSVQNVKMSDTNKAL